MPYPYSFPQVSPGDPITAAQTNAMHQAHVDNNIPTSIDDYSASTTQMRTVTNPGDDNAESFAVDLAGELARLRHEILWIKQQLATTNPAAYWYSKRTFDKYSFERIYKTVLTSSVSIVSITDLNITFPTIIRIEISTNNVYSAEIRLNGETNENDWTYQYARIDGTTVSAVRGVDASFFALSSGNNSIFSQLAIDDTGKASMISFSTDSSGPDYPRIHIFSTMRNTAITSPLTQIDLIVHYPFPAGTLIHLEKLI